MLIFRVPCPFSRATRVTTDLVYLQTTDFTFQPSSTDQASVSMATAQLDAATLNGKFSDLATLLVYIVLPKDKEELELRFDNLKYATNKNCCT